FRSASDNLSQKWGTDSQAKGYSDIAVYSSLIKLCLYPIITLLVEGMITGFYRFSFFLIPSHFIYNTFPCSSISKKESRYFRILSIGFIFSLYGINRFYTIWINIWHIFAKIRICSKRVSIIIF